MDPIQEFPARRFEAGVSSSISDPVICETRVEVDVNDGQFRLAMLCLARDLDALAAGFLIGEGILQRRQDLADLRVDPDRAKVFVRGDFDADALEAIARRWTWATGCGAGGTGRDLDSPGYGPLATCRAVSPTRLRALCDDFGARADLWARTGGTHACALADESGLLVFAEDIGRHNAFDKIMGRAFLDGLDVNDKLVLTTGRVSGEIVSKAVACRVPMLVSRSAVTDLAIKLARRFNITLVGFLRGRRLSVYSGFERVVATARE